MYLQPQTMHQHRLTEITELSTSFVGMLMTATWWTYDSNRQYGIGINIVQICGHRGKKTCLHSLFMGGLPSTERPFVNIITTCSCRTLAGSA